jgi:hypothetical protein
MNNLILNNIAGNRSDIKNLKKIRHYNLHKKNKIHHETMKSAKQTKLKRDDPNLIDLIFPDNLIEPKPVLSKNIKRDYILFDRVDDFGNKYRYGVFAVFSSWIKLDNNGEYLDSTKASNVYDITRVLTVKTLIKPQNFGSNSIGKPTYVEFEPVIEFLETDEDPTVFIDQIFLYNNGGPRQLALKKNSRKNVERDDLEDVVDPVLTPFPIESTISENKMFYDKHILDLYYLIVNMNYVSSTMYELLLQTIIMMLGIKLNFHS